MLFTVSRATDVFATQAFVYNSLTDTWTRWKMDRTCGVVNNVEDKLYMGKADSGQVMVERKTFTLRDYADEQFAVVISSIDSDTQLTITDSTNVLAGMTIEVGFRATVIDEVNGNTLTVRSTEGFNAGPGTVYTPILTKLQFLPITAGNPGILKQFSEMTLMFKDAAFRQVLVDVNSNIRSDDRTIVVRNEVFPSAWGNFIWGALPWGGGLGGNSVLRTYIPREKQRASWINVSISTEQAFTGFSLQGISIIFKPMSSRFR
jgi:hypothetical protein